MLQRKSVSPTKMKSVSLAYLQYLQIYPFEHKSTMGYRASHFGDPLNSHAKWELVLPSHLVTIHLGLYVMCSFPV